MGNTINRGAKTRSTRKGNTMRTPSEEYAIVRFEFPNFFEPTKVIKRGVTLQQAQDHCSREDTRKEGKWFDGYKKMKDLP